MPELASHAYTPLTNSNTWVWRTDANRRVLQCHHKSHTDRPALNLWSLWRDPGSKCHSYGKIKVMKIHKNINGIQTHVRSYRGYSTSFYHPKHKASFYIEKCLSRKRSLRDTYMVTQYSRISICDSQVARMCIPIARQQLAKHTPARDNRTFIANKST
jgi:hypothetical protein